MIKEELRGQIHKEVKTIEDALTRKNDSELRKHARELKKLCEESNKEEWIDLSKSFYEEVFEDDFDYWFVEKLYCKLNEKLSKKDEPAQKKDNNIDSLKILACEHNVMNREFLKILLKKLFENFEVVENGKEILEKMQNSNFDIALLDCDLKEENCQEILSDIIVLSKEKNIFLIGMSNDESQEIFKEMNETIIKPVQKDNLLRLLKKMGYE